MVGSYVQKMPILGSVLGDGAWTVRVYAQLNSQMEVALSFLLLKHAHQIEGKNPDIQDSFWFVLWSENKGHSVIAEINYKTSQL